MIVGIVLATLGFVGAGILAVAYLRALNRFEPVDILPSELVIGEERALLILDDSDRTGDVRRGKLILTQQRLLWTPIRFPPPRMGAQTIDLVDVESCEPEEGKFLFSGRPLVVATRNHRYQFYISYDYALRRARDSERWRRLIVTAVERAKGGDTE